jgi:hypothetical protein
MSDLKYGPQTEAIKALIERTRRLTNDEIAALAAAWGFPGAAARAARSAWAARAARDARAARSAWAAWAARALRDQLPPEHYRALTRAWALAVGRVHPDDPDRQGGDPDA